MQKMQKTRTMAQAAVIAALYAALTLSTVQFSFGALQFRAAEALCVLPFFLPKSGVLGLTLGCAIANLFSPFGLLDVVVGSSATLLAALLAAFVARRVKKEALAIALVPLGAVLFNGFFIGGEIYFLALQGGEAASFWLFCGQILLSQAASCYILGVPLLLMLRRIPYFRQTHRLLRMR